MNIIIKKLPKSRIEVRITVPVSTWEKHIEPATAHIAQHINVEGFRKGKAPRRVIEQQVGKMAILEDAAERAISEGWLEAMKTEKIEAIGRPKANIMKLAEGNDLEFVIETDVMPEIRIKDKWKKVVAKHNAKKKSELDKGPDVSKEVDAELKRLAESRAKLVTVDREAREGDAVKVDFHVSIGGVPIEGGTAKDHAIVLGSNVFIPGFEEAIVGMKASEEKTFSLSFPSEYHDAGVAGKKAEFVVTMKLVEERQIPELDDAFAVALGNFKDLVDLRGKISEGIAEEEKMKTKELHRSEISDMVLKYVDIEMPESLLDEEARRMLHMFEHRVSSMGMTFDQYLAQIKKTRDEMLAEFRTPAEKSAKLNLAFGDIAEGEEMQADTEEIEKRMSRVLAQFGTPEEAKKKIDMAKLYEMVRGEVLHEKVWEMLEKL
jgi:trigger factor